MFYLVNGTVQRCKAVGPRKRERLISAASATRAVAVYHRLSSCLGPCAAAGLMREAVRSLAFEFQSPPFLSLLAEVGDDDTKPVSEDKWLEWCEVFHRHGA
eukprot:Sspe_Gene.18975::Locus_6874_Transcript_6_7_Confidence_0.588_Length_659::g.18975::m.18975